jgi:hypothetical protein
MAISLVTTPTPLEVYTAYTPYVYTWTSNSVDIISCVVEILTDGGRVSARSVQPDLGTTNAFTLDIQKELQKYVDFELKGLASSGVLGDDEGYNTVALKIYEVTESGGLITTAYNPDDDNNPNYDSITQTTNYINWTESHFNLAGFTFEDYRLNGTTKEFLTGNPSVKDIELDQAEFIGILWHDGNSNENFKLEVLGYDSTNALLNTDFINVTDWNQQYSSTVAFPYLSIGVGTRNLIAAGISLTNVAYYTIQMVNDSGNVSEVKRYNIVGSCDSDVRIHFANKFGKQDSITLKGNYIEAIGHKQENFQKALGLTYDSAARGTSNIQNISNKEFTAFSKTIGRDTIAFANSILINKIAYLEVNGNYFGITIDNGKSGIINEEDMPIQFVLNFSLANPYKGLRG